MTTRIYPFRKIAQCDLNLWIRSVYLFFPILCTLAALFPVAATAAGEATQAAAQGAATVSAKATEKDGQWQLPDGTPIYHVGKDGAVDWYTASGFLRYEANCAQCHGPDGLGSSYAPDPTQSLQTIDYGTFMQIVSSGKQTQEGSTKVCHAGTWHGQKCHVLHR